MLAGNTNALVPGFITQVNLRCRIVDLSKVSADANTKFIYMLEKEISGSTSFVSDSVRFGEQQRSADGLTSMFQVNLTLKRPLKL